MFALAIVMCVVMIVQSPDWDSRGRSVTAPIDPAFYSSLPTTSLTYTSPGPHPVAQADLPPLPGEWGTPPPPLPKRGEVDDVGMNPPSVPRKGHTLPRKITRSFIYM